jgi:hypothetical protein
VLSFIVDEVVNHVFVLRFSDGDNGVMRTTSSSRGNRQRRRRMNRVTAVVVLSILTMRCATVARGRDQRIHVNSSPSGAAVRVLCGDVPQEAGIAPVDIVVPRKAQTCAVTLTKAGFADRTVTLTRMTSNMVWLNLIPGFIIGTVAGSATAFHHNGSVFNSNQHAGETQFFVGFAAGTALAAAIDHSTGAMYKQVPERIDGTLNPQR